MTQKEELEKLEKIGKHNRSIIKNWTKNISYEKLKELNDGCDSIYEGISAFRENKATIFIAEELEKVLNANMELLGDIEEQYDIKWCDRRNDGEEI